MDYNIETENIRSLLPMGCESVQTVIDSDIIVPDIKDDINYIIDCSAKAVITEENILDGRIGFKGRLDLQIIYCCMEGKTCTLKSFMPFEDFIISDGISSGDFAMLSPTVEKTECRMINSRKAYVKCIVSVKAFIQAMNDTSVSANINGEDLHIKYTPVSFKETSQSVNDTFRISEDLHLPQSKKAIDDILFLEESVLDVDMKAVDGGIKVSGTTKLRIIYTSADDDETDCVNFEIPLDGFTEGRNIHENDIVCGKIYIKKCAVDIFTDNEGNDRGISAQIDYSITAEAFSEKTINISQDAYSGKVCTNTTQKEFSYPVFVGRNRNEISLKEKFKTDGDEIMRLIGAWGNISYCDAQAGENSITINAIAYISILCLSKSDSTPYISIRRSVPFSREAELIGCAKNDYVCVTSQITDIQVNVLNNSEAEADIRILFDICVQKIKNEMCIEKTEECAEQTDTPSAAIYIVQKGDTLWDISKKYRTGEESIALLNTLENNEIHEGQKILIMKKVNL